MHKYLRNMMISVALLCAVGAIQAMEWGAMTLSDGLEDYFDDRWMAQEPDNKKIIKRLAKPAPGAEKMSSDCWYLKALQKSIELQEAIDQQNLEAVKALIEEQGTDLAFVSFGALLPLSQAIRSGAVDIVKYFISINAARGRNCSIYVPETLQPGKATDEQRLECAKMLIENGSFLPFSRLGALDRCLAKSCYRQLKKYLLANIKFQNSYPSGTSKADMSAVKNALDDGAYINLAMSALSVTGVQSSFLYQVVFSGADQSSIIDFLLERGAIMSSETVKKAEKYADQFNSSARENVAHLKKALMQRALKEEFASKESYLGTYQGAEAKKGGKLPLELREKLLEYVFFIPPRKDSLRKDSFEEWLDALPEGPYFSLTLRDTWFRDGYL